MAENIVASSANSSGSLELQRSPRASELIKLVCTATAAGDTSNAFTLRYLTNPVGVVGGGVTASFSGRIATFTALAALGSNTIYVEVIEAL